MAERCTRLVTHPLATRQHMLLQHTTPIIPLILLLIRRLATPRPMPHPTMLPILLLMLLLTTRLKLPTTRPATRHLATRIATRPKATMLALLLINLAMLNQGKAHNFFDCQSTENIFC